MERLTFHKITWLAGGSQRLSLYKVKVVLLTSK